MTGSGDHDGTGLADGFCRIVGVKSGGSVARGPKWRQEDVAQRRYEALRAYFVEELSAEAVGERFGYTRATVETLVREFRAGRLSLFASSRPGPRAQPKKDRARTLALGLRREGRSLREIERALHA